MNKMAIFQAKDDADLLWGMERGRQNQEMRSPMGKVEGLGVCSWWGWGGGTTVSKHFMSTL